MTKFRDTPQEYRWVVWEREDGGQYLPRGFDSRQEALAYYREGRRHLWSVVTCVDEECFVPAPMLSENSG